MTWEFKLEPTAEQISEIEHILDLCRNVWNFALPQRKDWLNSRKLPVNACSIQQAFILPADAPFPNYHVQAKRLTAAKANFPANWLKLHKKIGRVHQRIADTRKDWHFKLAHHLCDGAGMISGEDLDFRIMAKGMLGQHPLDAGLGQFIHQILPGVCFKREVYYGKVDPRGTSQDCLDCGAAVKKRLERESASVP